MPDDRFDPRPPASWADAFASLPLEAPDHDGWRRIAHAQAKPRRARRWPLVASAAALAVMVAVPAWLANRHVSGQHPFDGAAVPIARNATPGPAESSDGRRPADVPQGDMQRDARIAAAGGMGDSAPARSEVAEPPVRLPSTTTQRRASQRTVAASTDRTNDRATPLVAAVAASNGAHATRRAAAEWTADATPTQSVIADPVAADTRVATASAPTASPAGAADSTQAAELQRLYAESAQLESLLAIVRDERVSSGTAAALASDLDARVASIDAALVQPDAARDDSVGLWRDRVQALRQLASFESSRRLLAARGQRYDAMLVGID